VSAVPRAPFERKLVSKTYDGLATEPLYSRDAAARPITGRTPGMPWQVMARTSIPIPRPPTAKPCTTRKRRDRTVAVCGSTGPTVRHREQRGRSARVLQDVRSTPAFRSTAGGRQPEIVAAALSDAEERGTAPEAADVRFGFDLLGICDGRRAPPWDEHGARFAAQISALAGQGHKGPFAVADGRAIHNAGGSEAQELAFALSVALAYLRVLEAGGVALENARRMIYFRLAADADQFMTTAKFRALRKLWARIEEACGLLPT
jgi:methylmalonyl-CoA mutase